jgi:O-antigen/teichoic acid export membrane protein
MSLKQAQQSAFSAVKWLTASSYVTFVASFINSILITRGLGPEQYGVYSYLIWMIAISMSVTIGGLNITAIKFIAEAMGAQDVNRAHALYGWMKRLLWTSLAVMTTFLIVTALIPGIYPISIEKKIVLYMAFVLACTLTKAIFMFEMSVSKGYSIFSTEAIAASSIGISSTAISGVFYLMGMGLNAYLGLFLLASVAHPIIAITMMRKYEIKPSDEPLDDELKGRLHSSLRWNFSLSLAGLLSTKSLDTYLLGLHAGTAYVGYYNIAAMLAKSGLDLLSTGFSSMLLTFISKANGQGGISKVQHIFSVSVRFYQYVGILVAGVGYIMAERVIMVLYGQSYLDVVPALRVMAVVGGFTLPAASYSALFIATDHHAARLRFVVSNAVISCTSSFVFIPWLGFKGALLSNMVGNVLSYSVVAVVAHRSLGIRFPFRKVAMQWLAAGVAFAIVMAVMYNKSSLPLSIAASAVFVLLFSVFAINFGAWEESDLQMLQKNSKLFNKVSKFVQFRKPG